MIARDVIREQRYCATQSNVPSYSAKHHRNCPALKCFDGRDLFQVVPVYGDDVHALADLTTVVNDNKFYFVPGAVCCQQNC